MAARSLRRPAFVAVYVGIIGQFSLAISGVLAARALGVEDRGYLAMLTLFPLCIAILVGAEIPQACTYYIAKQRKLTYRLFTLVRHTFLLQALVIGLLHLLVLSFYLEGKSSVVGLAAYLSLLIGPLTLLQEYGFSLLQGQHRFSILNFCRLLSPVLNATIIAVLYMTDAATVAPYLAALVVTLGLASITTVTAAILGQRETGNPSVDAPTIGQLAGFGLRGFVGRASLIETFRLDQLMAGLFVSPAALGLYVVGRAFTNIPTIVAMSAATIAYPSVAAAGPNARGIRIIRKYFWTVTLCNILISTTVVILLPWFLPFLFGAQFEESVLLAQLLLLATTVYGSYRILAEGLRGLGIPQVSSYAELSTWPWLLLGLSTLALLYGATGLAIGTIVSHGIALTVALILARRVRPAVRDLAQSD